MTPPAAVVQNGKRPVLFSVTTQMNCRLRPVRGSFNVFQGRQTCLSAAPGFKLAVNAVYFAATGAGTGAGVPTASTMCCISDVKNPSMCGPAQDNCPVS